MHRGSKTVNINPNYGQYTKRIKHQLYPVYEPIKPPSRTNIYNFINSSITDMRVLNISSFTFFLLLRALAVTAADNNATTYLGKGWFPRPLFPQFQSWYPKYSDIFSNFSTGICNESLKSYLNALAAPAGSLEASLLLDFCYQHEACILSALSPDRQAIFSSAAVILGLTPTILSTLGPSINDIALLSAHRPLLSFLLSFGSPAVWPTRIFEYTCPTSVLESPASPFRITRLGPRSASALSAVQYVLAVAAIANVVTTAVDMSRKTVLSWGCTTNFTPLLWPTLVGVVHIISVSSYFAERQLQKPPSNEGLAINIRTTKGTIANKSNRKSYRWLVDVWKSETTICANRPKMQLEPKSSTVPNLAVLLHIAAGCCSFVHLTFGTVIFSSLLFVSTWDVLNQILWRYIVSTVVCRLILLVELAGLRVTKGDD